MDAPVKFAVLKLRNVSGRPRRLSVTGYWEWVLGDLRHKTLLHVQTEMDLKTGALLARNLYNTEFPDRVAFVDVNDPNRTPDRRPQGVPRPQRHARATGRAETRAAFRQGRRRTRSVRRAAGRVRSRRWRRNARSVSGSASVATSATRSV